MEQWNNKNYKMKKKQLSHDVMFGSDITPFITCFPKNSKKCLVTRVYTACDSKPITARSCEPI